MAIIELSVLFVNSSFLFIFYTYIEFLSKFLYNIFNKQLKKTMI